MYNVVNCRKERKPLLRIAIYSRKSIETDTGESINNQIAICRRYFEREDQECKFEVFEDEGFSGGNTRRPDFQRMMELVKAKQFDVIAVYKVDRIARNIVDFVNIFDNLEKQSVKLVSVTEGFDPSTPIGKMMMLLLASFAEMERMNISQRVKDNMHELAKRGYWSGGTAPAGYEVERVFENGKHISYLAPIESVLANVRDIFLKYSQGYTGHEISKYLNGKGADYKAHNVYDIITNPTYLKSSKESVQYLQGMGYTVYGKPNGSGFLPYNRRPRKNGVKSWNDSNRLAGVSKHEAPIDIELWSATQSQLKKKAVEPHPRESKFTYLSGGIMKCKCGGGLSVSVSKLHKDGTRTYYFTCRSDRYKKSDCDNLSIRVDTAESRVRSYLQSICDKDILTEMANRKKKPGNIEREIKSINKKILENKKTMDSLIDKLALFSKEAAIEISQRIEDLTKNNNLLKEELLKMERERIFNERDAINIDVLYNDIVEFLSTNEFDIKKKAIRRIFEKIVWDSDKEELRFFLI